ncbi:MAG TPA: protein kinase [Polyangiaceae bacterium]|nr:protein kinase [Polyangiaceae bacterium]
MPSDPRADATAVLGPPGNPQEVLSAGPVFGTQLSAGQLLAGRFEVRGLAGVGGMGAVYRAWDRQTSALVALKLLAGQNAEEERFSREARVLAELEHPAIVRHVAHGALPDGALYLAMEWLEGTDLSETLQKHGLTIRESVELVRRAAEGVGVAHARGIVHRDLGPRNLFLVRGSVSEVKVLDFGIAMVGSLATRITVTGSALGTPGYMAPEQAQGSSEVTARADVFSLGCVLFECLTGRRAFAGRTLMELLAKILVDDVPLVSTLGVRVPPELDRLVAQMLAKRPDERPADGAAVAALLRELAELDDTPPEHASTRRASLTTGEQRVLSVILAGDPEGVSPPGDNAAEALAEIVAPFGAQLGQLANRSLVVTVSGRGGGRGSAADRVVQAARCALAIRQRFPLLPLALGTGRGIASGRWPAGQAIERASAYMKLSADGDAPPDSSGGQPIFVDEVTAGLLDARFDVRGDHRGLMLRGLRETNEPARTVLGTATQLVGRNRELLTLEATYQECQEDSVARVVLLTCPPGFGKSRLAHEFLRKLRLSESPPEIWQAQGDPLSAGSPFALLSQAIRRASGVLDGEQPQVSRQKLRARIGRHLPEARAQSVAEFVGELVATPFPDENNQQLRAARQDPVLAGDLMLRAFEDWLEAECAHGPLLLAFEDLHWGDLPTVRFIDSALRQLAERPVMVLALARPEVHDTFANLWARRGVVELRLSELGRKACETLARQVLGSGARENAIERIVERAGGNALWLEELLRAEVEGRGSEVSDTVMVLAQSRLEALDPEARLVLRAASVFGQRFWRGGVELLLGGPGGVSNLDGLLGHLVEREIVLARGASRFPSQREFEFRNGLFREAAYATLTDDDRELGHRLAAGFLTQAGESDALLLAEHCERGRRPERAVEWYLRASHQALEGSDWAGAVARAQRGIDCGGSRDQLGLLRLLQAEACKWQGKNQDAQQFALEAIECLPRFGSAWCSAVAEAAVASGKLGDLERCDPLSQELLRAEIGEENARALVIALSRTATQLVLAGAVHLADRLLERVDAAADRVSSEPSVMGWVFEARAVRAGTGRDPSARVALAEAAVEQFRKAGDLRNACLQQTSLGFACVETGANALAEQALSAAVSVAERLGLSNSIPIARAQLGRALARRGELDSARQLLTQAVEAFDEQGNQRLGGIARCYLAEVLTEGGDLRGAQRAAREAVLMVEGIPAFRRTSLATLAAVHLARGAIEDARDSSEAAISGLGPLDEVSLGESLVRLVHAETLLACEQTEAARSALRVACDRLRERAERIADPERRAAFLNGVPENARTLRLAETWGI